MIEARLRLHPEIEQDPDENPGHYFLSKVWENKVLKEDWSSDLPKRVESKPVWLEVDLGWLCRET